MPIAAHIPLSLYIHIPWCIRKCPYCDFNSHQQKGELPEAEYIKALIQDLEADLPSIWGRKLHSIFIGGGTPSLFSAKAIDSLLSQVQMRIPFEHPNIEITMEANPGTFEQQRFTDFHNAGVNRLSIGVQSFDNDCLQALGRVHDKDEALTAAEGARKAGFDNFNLDLMHGLPKQSVSAALDDLQTAISMQPTHLSWYQLTLEPNTVFAKYPPTLPAEDTLADIQQQGSDILKQAGFEQYEVSAYCNDEQYSQHNLNYWQFGDYLGIGAGAHGKVTNLAEQSIVRIHKTRNPTDYLNPNKKFIAGNRLLKKEELPLEFFMNALRLRQGVPAEYFEQRTGLALSDIEQQLAQAHKQSLMINDSNHLCTTEQGFRFLNNCLSLFMEDSNE